MNVLELIMQNGGPAVIGQVARRVGVPEDQAADLLARLMPALGQGVKRQLGDPDQLQSLVGELSQGRARQVLDNPEELERDETLQEGNAILGKVFGSKDVSRNVATRVAEQAGTSPDIVKQLLPLAATLLMGVLGKEGEKKGMLGQGLSPGSVGGSAMASVFLDFLDMDDDGDVMDDVLNLAQKFFR